MLKQLTPAPLNLIRPRQREISDRSACVCACVRPRECVCGGESSAVARDQGMCEYHEHCLEMNDVMTG